MTGAARPLENKLVLVTGGGVRVGRAIAEGVSRAGGSVALHFHSSQAQAEGLLETLRADGNRAEKFQADLCDSGSIRALVERVEAQMGPIGALVNSAALFERADLLETSEAMLERQWALNARAPYLLTQAVARGMLARGGGDVVNVLDVGGALQPWRGYSAYCMTKAALAMLTRCLAAELAPAIRVNAVAPGTVLPPEGMSPELLEVLRARIPQKRFGSPSDVVEAVLFFLTGPRFITGQILAVDGGRTSEGGRS